MRGKGTKKMTGAEQYEFDMIRNSLETIASQSMNAFEPETMKQAKDNLLGMARLCLSACASHGIEIK